MTYCNNCNKILYEEMDRCPYCGNEDKDSQSVFEGSIFDFLDSIGNHEENNSNIEDPYENDLQEKYNRKDTNLKNVIVDISAENKIKETIINNDKNNTPMEQWKKTRMQKIEYNKNLIDNKKNILVRTITIIILIIISIAFPPLSAFLLFISILKKAKI